MGAIDRVAKIIDSRIEADGVKPDAVVLSIREYEEWMGEIAKFDPRVCDKSILSFSALRWRDVIVLCGDESGG